VRRSAPILLLLVLLAGTSRAEAPVVSEARRVLADGAARLLGGDLRGAEGALERARDLADEAGEAPLSIEVRLHLGELFARSGRMPRGLAAVAEAIALADGLEARGEAPPGPSVAVRVQAAEMLRAHDRPADSEAAGWDALARAVALGRLELSGPPIRLILLGALDQGASPAALASLAAELDLALSPLDAYRLALPPPPEPIAVGVEALGRQLLESGEAALAAETLGAVAAFDAARGAGFRLPADLSRLATAASLAGDRGRARWASDLALGLQGDRPTSEVLGAVCTVALEEGRHAHAADACGKGAAATSGFAAGALLARRALALDRAGRLEEAAAAREAARGAFEAAGATGDALIERAERAWLLARLGRYEASGRELVAAVAGSKGTGAEPRVEELRLRVALHDVRAGRVEEAQAAAVLGEVGKWLFDAGRADDLAALAALHVDRALAAGDLAAAEQAAEHAIDFERQLGLADEGWRALDARARVHDRAGRSDDARADRREVFARALRLRRGPAPIEDPFFPRTLSDAAAAFPPGVAGEAPGPLDRDVALRQAGLRRFGEPRPRSPEEQALVDAEADVDAARAALHAVSFGGSERPLDEVRSEIEPRLRAARDARDAALAALVAVDPRRAWLRGAAIERPQTVGPPARSLDVDVACPGSAPPEAARRSLDDATAAEIAAVAGGATPPASSPSLMELPDLDVAGAEVRWPPCRGLDDDVRLGLWLAGAR
jgi:tetratricopeptide (TPR) repeat protein